jgi:outer membrane murein-binding lipoprotein Lpp
MKKIIRTVIVGVVVGAIFLTGCVTTALLNTSSSTAPQKSETASITGTLEKEKNHFVLTDARSGVSYRFVGLKKADEARLSPYVGKTVTVQLKVISTESAKVRIAQLVAILR